MRTLQITTAMVVGFVLTCMCVIAFYEYRLYHEMRAWRMQAAAANARLIEFQERELCVLWLSGEQRAAFRGGAQVDTVERPTWSLLCDWMKGISP